MGVKSKKVKKVPISKFVTSASDPTTSSTSTSSSSTSTRVRSSDRPVVSRKITQSTISRFHTLLKRQAHLKRSLQVGNAAGQSTQQELASIEAEINSLGGLNAYQIASTLGQSNERGGDSSKVLVKWLDELGVKQQAIDGNRKLRMLEIGALVPTNYASCHKWIDNRPIDLNSQHPDILEQDFFERPLPSSDEDAFDVVSCSLVLNFVSSPSERGRMLSLIRQQLRDEAKRSFLFLVLPLPCLTNSRYLSLSTFNDLMRAIGFKLEKEQWKTGGKVGYWLYSKCASEGVGDDRWRRKLIVQDGAKKNNFAVTLP